MMLQLQIERINRYRCQVSQHIDNEVIKKINRDFGGLKFREPEQDSR